MTSTTCTKWHFVSAPYATKTTTTFCNSNSKVGYFSGPMGSINTIYQDTVADYGGSSGTKFDFDYTVESANPSNNFRDELDIYLLDASTGAVLAHVDTIIGAHWCYTRHIDLGAHPEWIGKNIRVELDAYVPDSDANFKVAGMAFWQTTQ